MITELCSPYLLELPTEIITEIIKFCKWDDVLRLGQTCKYLQLICHDMSVWKSLLTELTDDESPCLPPHIFLNTLSASELKTAIIKGLRTSKAWNRHGDTLHPTSIIELQIPKEPSSNQWATRLDVRLLPGAKHALIEHGNIIQIWDVEKGVKLGSTPACFSYDLCLTFDVEVVRGGKGVVIAAIFIDTDTCRCCLFVSSFDMGQHKGEILVERILPYSIVVNVMVRGDIVMTQLPHEYGVILINWRTGESMLVDFCDSSARFLSTKAAITGKDIVLVAAISGLMMVSFPISYFDGRWSQSPFYNQWEVVTVTIDPQKSKSISQTQLALPFDKLELDDWPVVLVIHPFTTAWRGPDSCTEVFIVASGRAHGLHRSKRILTYKVRMLPNNRMVLQKQACVPTTNMPWDPYCVVNAGRMYELFDGKVLGFNLFPSTDLHGTLDCAHKIVDLAESLSVEEMRLPVACVADPYSGTVAVSTPELVRVLRFD